jgi:hypothetical protein
MTFSSASCVTVTTSLSRTDDLVLRGQGNRHALLPLTRQKVHNDRLIADHVYISHPNLHITSWTDGTHHRIMKRRRRSCFLCHSCMNDPCTIQKRGGAVMSEMTFPLDRTTRHFSSTNGQTSCLGRPTR